MMVCHRLNENTRAIKKLFEAKYSSLSKKGHPVFKGDGGPYDYKYRLKFEEAEEVHSLITDLVEVYNRMVDNDKRALQVVTIVTEDDGGVS